MSKPRLFLAALLAASVLSACGGGGGDASPRAVTEDRSDAVKTTVTTTPATSINAAKPLPNVDVLHVDSGRTVALRSLAVAEKPTLLWFWAPHCVFCKREAPDVKAFAAKHGDRIQIIGVGAQDSRREAEEFVRDTGTGNLAMVWEDSGSTWVHYGVSSQPTLLVLSPSGQKQGQWFRDFDEADILDAAGLAA